MQKALEATGQGYSSALRWLVGVPFTRLCVRAGVAGAGISHFVRWLRLHFCTWRRP